MYILDNNEFFSYIQSFVHPSFHKTERYALTPSVTSSVFHSFFVI